MYDVGIVGMGAMGSTAAWRMARRGRRVIGFEQFSLGHDRGASAGETRIFRVAYREGDAYVPLLLSAERLWEELEADTGFTLRSHDGVASIGAENHPYISTTLQTIERHGLRAEVLEPGAANRRFPALNVLPGEVAVLDSHGGLIRPEMAVTVAARFAEDRGARILRHTKVTAIEPDSSGVWVHAGGAQYRVGRLVVCAGAWMDRFLNPSRAGLITPHRLVLHWFPLRRPELFMPGRFPVVLRNSLGSDLGIFPSQDGQTIKAGLAVDIGPIADADGLDRSVEPWESARTRALLAELYPDVWPEPVRAASYVDGFTPDENAVVGSLPDMPNVIFAGGFSAHGFKLAPAIGEALADLTERDETVQPIGHLALDRKMNAIGRNYLR